MARKSGFRLKTDADYEKLGLKPPVHIPHEGSDSVRPDNHDHIWQKVEGPYIECSEGENYNHGIPFDHLNKRFIGTSPEGAPIFEDIVTAENRPEYQALLDKIAANKQ